jgi:hypothetical protein
MASLTLKQLVDANQSRPIAMIGPESDTSLRGRYGFLRHGLVLRIEPADLSLDLNRVAAENDAVMRGYHPPQAASIKRATFEPNLLRSYAAPAEWIASGYMQLGDRTAATRWYRRALEIDPDFLDARQGLARADGR